MSPRSARRRRSAGIVLYRRPPAPSRCCSSIPADLSGPGATTAPGRSPRASTRRTRTPLAAARREFEEELGTAAPAGEPVDLGEIRQKSGKVVHAWALAGDLDRGHRPQQHVRRSSGRRGRARCASSPRSTGPSGSTSTRPGSKINPAQVPLLDRLEQLGPPAGRERLGHDQPHRPLHGLGVAAQRPLAPRLATTEGRVLFDSLHPLMLASARLGRPVAGELSAGPPPGDRRAAGAGDRAARRDSGDRGGGRAVAARVALRPALRRAPHLHRGRPARHGRSASARPCGGSARSDEHHRVGELDALQATAGPAAWPRWRRRWTTRPAWRSSPRACWAISSPDDARRCGGGSPRTLTEFRDRALHLGPASGAASRTAEVAGVPRRAVGVRARPRVPALRTMRRGRGGRCAADGFAAAQRSAGPTRSPATPETEGSSDGAYT